MNMKIKSKILLIFCLLIIIGMVYSLTEVLFPRDRPAKISAEGSARSQKFTKEQQNNHYYIIFLEYDNGEASTIKVECNKEQYDFIQGGKEYHMIYRKNYFNRKTGKVKILDDKPIKYGIWYIA